MLSILFLSLTITLLLKIIFNNLSNYTIILLFLNIFLLNYINYLHNKNIKIKKEKKNIKIKIKKFRQHPVKVLVSPIEQNNKKEWTSDKIIPLKNYNKNDCTNDSTCIISPDKYNLFPPKNYSVSDKIIQPKIEEPKHILFSMKHCKLCNSILDLENNKVTENFTTYNPYRPNDSYSNPEKIERKKKLEDILTMISSNIKNNKPNTNINIEDIRKISKNLCIHCKTGLCLNDTCYSI